MIFFSLLYRKPEDKQKSNVWMKWTAATHKNKERTFEYIGTHMVEVKKEEDDIKYPAFYEDLNLDQIMEKIYDRNLYPQLDEMYTTLVSDEEIIYYRQDIMRDLEKVQIYEAFAAFQNALQEVKRKIAESKTKKYELQAEFIYLEAIESYCTYINKLEKFCEIKDIQSEGLKNFSKAIRAYSQGKYFGELNKKITELKAAIEKIHYQLILHENKVIVRVVKDEEKFKEVDYSQRLRKALGIFQEEETLEGQGKISLFAGEELNPLEIKIIEVLKLHHEALFKRCHETVEENKNFIAEFIEQVHGEIPFYINFIGYMKKLKEKNLKFTYPKFAAGEINIKGIYDLSLTQKKEAVTNDFEIYKEEKGACITGANQGGKTTFLRSLGQLIYFSTLGFPVAASEAKLPLYERLYTHFSQAEDANTHEGKLKEEVIQLKEIFKTANDRSIVLMNELFSSTTASDAFEMSKSVIQELESLGSTIFLVTHVTALAQEKLNLASMVAEVETDKNNQRTYKIIRKAADGRAYTQGLIKKYQLSYEAIKERIGDEN